MFKPHMARSGDAPSISYPPGPVSVRLSANQKAASVPVGASVQSVLKCSTLNACRGFSCVFIQVQVAVRSVKDRLAKEAPLYYTSRPP